MASSREYLDFILEQLSGLERIAYRAMMGEFILYYRGKIVGGITVFWSSPQSLLWRGCRMQTGRFPMKEQEKCCL